MADLSEGAREHLNSSQFALPKKAKTKKEKGESGNYPIPDKKHARAALSLVAKNGSPEEKKKVRAAVHKKFPNIK